MIKNKNNVLPQNVRIFDTKKETEKFIISLEEDYKGVSEVIYAPVKHLKTGKFYVTFLGAFR